MPAGPTKVVLSVLGVPDRAAMTPSDVLLIDDQPAAANDYQDRESWLRIAGERARGTTVVVATSREEYAYRGDRVTLAVWEDAQLEEALWAASRRIEERIDEFLCLSADGHVMPSASIAVRLRRLNQAVRDLLKEASRRSRSRHETRRLQDLHRELTSQQIDDRVLDAVIRQAYDR